jgi:hypothetical protein
MPDGPPEPVGAPAPRVRLNLITAGTDQAGMRITRIEGIGEGRALQVGPDCSMIAWPRWVLSAVTVSITTGSVVVKKA